ncbi:MAG TPA: YdeI/OmpD-associated family protein [Chitinophagaceae bacterium]|nr:YdeI/OmpD-associated family protein [Chitinophagaceae bacterium]
MAALTEETEMTATFFATELEFREWLEKHHEVETEFLVGFYKVGSGKASMTWSPSVDQALCFGWIDGVRKSINAESFSIRFTPRKDTSIWSAINIRKVDELRKAGLMTAWGQRAFDLRAEDRSNIYSHENEALNLTAAFKKKFKAENIAWRFFNQQAPSYKKVMIHWIMSAKQEKTRLLRLEKTIRVSAQQKRME